MEWTKTFIAQKTITGTFVDFMNDHIVEMRKHKDVGKNTIYDLYCRSTRGQGNLERVTSILVPTNVIDTEVYVTREEMVMFRQLAKDGKITEDMLDGAL